jgi:hypothetical protein
LLIEDFLVNGYDMLMKEVLGLQLQGEVATLIMEEEPMDESKEKNEKGRAAAHGKTWRMTRRTVSNCLLLSEDDPLKDHSSLFS